MTAKAVRRGSPRTDRRAHLVVHGLADANLSENKKENQSGSVVVGADGSYSWRRGLKVPDEHASDARPSAVAPTAPRRRKNIMRRSKRNPRPHQLAALEERLVNAMHYQTPLDVDMGAPQTAVQLPAPAQPGPTLKNIMRRSRRTPRPHQPAALQERLGNAMHSQAPLAVVMGAPHTAVQLPAPAQPGPTLLLTDVVLYFFASVGLIVCAWMFFQQLQTRKQGERDISPRAKAIRASRNQSALEANHLEDPENLRQLLVQAGIDTEPLESGRGVEQLAGEVKNKTCEVLWVDDPERSGRKSKSRRLVRLVRLVRALISLDQEDKGISVLYEQSRTTTVLATKKHKTEQVFKPLTFKLSLDEKSPTTHFEEFVETRLFVPREWQQRYMKLEDQKANYVEEQDSRNYPGLSTWYLIEEWSFHIDLTAVPEEDMTVFGLPDQQAFTTMNATDTETVLYSWKWHANDSSAEGFWRRAKEESSSGDQVDVARFNMARNAGRESLTPHGGRRSRSRGSKLRSSGATTPQGQRGRSKSLSDESKADVAA